MFYLYILHNKQVNKYYVGYTSDLDARILEHNKSPHKSKFTRKQPGEWKLVYKESYSTRLLAIRREKEIKSWKSKLRIAQLVEHSR